MNRVPDRKKMRREYLDRKADAYARAIEGGLLIGAVLLFLAHSKQLTIAGFNVWEEHFDALFGVTGSYDRMLRSFTTVLLPTTALAGSIAGLLSVRGIRLIKQARKVASIPYAPPVTPSILPAEEILVRAAEQPSAPSETLLRAMQASSETASDQLLRVVPDATEAHNQ